MSQLRMVKLTRAALLLALFAALALVMAGLPGSAAAAPTCTTECFVDPAGNDGNAGTLASPLLTIQAAVNQVDPNGTVHVAAGTYVELVVLNKSVILVGAGPATTIIRASAASTGNSAVVTVTGSGVSAEVSGFTITRPATTGTVGFGVYVRDAAFADIHNNIIVDIRDNPLSGNQYGQGIQIGRNKTDVPTDITSGTAIVKDNIISGFQKNGINVIGATSSATIEGNTVTGNGPVGLGLAAQNGIQVSFGATATITGNNISDISYTPLSYVATGILITDAGETFVTDNTLTNTQMGIYVSNSSTTIRGNAISATTSGTQSSYYWGIWLYNANTGVMIVDIVDNSFSSDKSTGGFAIDAGAGWGANVIDLEIRGNSISNWDYGVTFECNTTCGAGFSPLTFNANSISGNNNGVENLMPGTTVNALYNWWGNADGPSGEGTGNGDTVSENVLFDPFLTSAALPAVTLTPPTGPVCNSGTVGIAFANMPAIYGYEFKVEYNVAKLSATSAFDNSWFVTTDQYILWPAGTCTGGECKLAVTKQGSAPVSGGGTVATVNLTAVSGGLTPIKIKEVVVSDIDGFRIPVSVANDTIEIGVCGTASVSGKISLQGRLTPMDAGSVTLVDTATVTPFPAITVPFDANGNFSVTGIPVLPTGSTYSIRALHGLYLDNLKSAPGLLLLPGAALTGQNTRLLGGDANNDAIVEIGDLGCMGGVFGNSVPNIGNCGGTGSPDINLDLKVNIQDLSIAGGNYGKISPQNW